MDAGPAKPLNDWLTRKPVARNVPLRIAVYYLIFGVIWITTTDWALKLLTRTTGDPLGVATRIAILKGWIFVASTSILLFVIVRSYIRSLQKAQEDLEGIAAQYQLLFQRSPSSMFIYDLETLRLLAVNDASILQFGYGREKLLSMTVYDLLAPEEQRRAVALAADFIAHPRPGAEHAGIWRCVRGDGTMASVESVLHRVDFEGRVAGIALVIDVTERLRTEEALAQYRTLLEQRVAERTAELSHANEKLVAEVEERQRVEMELRTATAAAHAASNAKSTFLANTSHEIRTPLTSILGYADLLADRSLGHEQRDKYLEVLRQNAEHLLALIDDLLDLSHAESGKVSVTFNDHSPCEIARQAVELLHPRAREKSVELFLQCADEVPGTIRTDGVRLRQILLNLLSNAIKFTEKGSVALRVSLLPAPEASGVKRLCFEVTDTGIGMSAEDLHRVFEPFFQVQQYASRRVGGFGLGLAISRQLAERMGGQLSVASAIGRGSTFTLVLPLRPAETLPVSAPGSAMAHSLAGRRIVLAEDNANIRLLVTEYLVRAGAKVTAVANGEEAVAQVRETLNGRGGRGCIDLVLMDLHMPVLDGLGALRQIRQAGFKGPIVGLTADYAQNTAGSWGADGWDAMAAKPIDRQEFIPLLARLIESGAPSDSVDVKPGTPTEAAS